MKVALFVPCFIDALFPHAGIATLELLEKLGVDVDYPRQQTCCGQPIANNGCVPESVAIGDLFTRNFAGYDYIVAPSSSCVHHVRSHLAVSNGAHGSDAVRSSTYELPWASFPHAVGLHNSCSAIRHLNAASMSELPGKPWSKARTLLEGVHGIRIVEPQRPDECCGFGGTFSVAEAAVSVRMGQDKVRDHADAGAECIVSADMSCLMHQQGCAARASLPVSFLHIAEVLNGSAAIPAKTLAAATWLS